MAVIYNKGQNKPRTAKDLIEERNRLLLEAKEKRTHKNKYAEKHKQEKEEKENKNQKKKTPGATPYLQNIVNKIYSNDEIKNFDMAEAIDESILSNKSGAVRSRLAYKFIMDNRNITAKYMVPGQICLFSYNDPKTKEDLDYWDKTPLVLFFGAFKTESGEIREIGLNLHYFPPFTRKKVLDNIYNSFKKYFDLQFNHPKNKQNAAISYRALKHIISKDAKIAFAVKEYIPTLRGITYVLPTKLLPIAFYTEGHFSKATIKQIQKFWRSF